MRNEAKGEMVKSDTTKLSSLQSKHRDTLDELKKYKLLVDSVQDYAIFLMDKNGYIQTWNKGAEKNKGYKKDEIVGKHFSNFYPRQDVEEEKPERELSIARKYGRIEDEGWRIRKDGSRFWANVVITALYDDKNELVGFAKVTRDLTERKRQEDKIRNANASLLVQKEELKVLNDSKDEFISLASHQLRTPATAIKQLLGLLLEGLEGELSPSLQAIIQKSYESNERQIAIINSLLKVAQIDAGKVVLKKAPVDVETLIKGAIEELNDGFTRRHQTVTLTVSHDNAVAHVDAQYLRMALENIIDNASKYTFDYGEIEISVRRDADTIVIIVKDNGVGINSHDQVTLFDKFKRIPNDLSQKVPGSGLGLYWVNKVIELHGGCIEVNSELGKGTTFYISIPDGQKNA